jgi:hypothetical protein
MMIRLRSFGDVDRDWIARGEGLLDGMVEPCIEVLLRVLGQIVVGRTFSRLTTCRRKGWLLALREFMIAVLLGRSGRVSRNLRYKMNAGSGGPFPSERMGSLALMGKFCIRLCGTTDLKFAQIRYQCPHSRARPPSKATL